MFVSVINELVGVRTFRQTAVSMRNQLLPWKHAETNQIFIKTTHTQTWTEGRQAATLLVPTLILSLTSNYTQLQTYTHLSSS